MEWESSSVIIGLFSYRRLYHNVPVLQEVLVGAQQGAQQEAEEGAGGEQETEEEREVKGRPFKHREDELTEGVMSLFITV